MTDTESTDTDTAEPELSAGEQTKQRVLAAAVELARRDGINEVTHRRVGAVVELSASNVKYHVGSADELRRAVALRIIEAADVLPHWYNYTLTVRRMLPAGHRWSLLPGDASAVECSPAELQIAEAMAWIARNGGVE